MFFELPHPGASQSNMINEDLKRYNPVSHLFHQPLWR